MACVLGNTTKGDVGPVVGGTEMLFSGRDLLRSHETVGIAGFENCKKITEIQSRQSRIEEAEKRFS